MNSRCESCGHIDPLEHARGIITEVANEHEVPRMKIIDHDRHPDVVSARGHSIRRIRVETDLCLREIGALFDGRHYSTIFHYLKGGNGTGARAAATSRQAQG